MALLVLIGFCANTPKAEVVQIKPYSFSVIDGAGGWLGWFGFYSSDSIMNSNNPFTPTTNPDYPSVEFVLKEQLDLFLTARGVPVVGISETMITDSYSGAYITPPPPIYTIERPFLGARAEVPRILDREVLNGLNEWAWDGTPPLGIQYVITPAGYTTPAATGTFNQDEQKFYVADGRQYLVVPEPSALSLLAVGLGGLAMMRRRRS
jgi:hypothetical protein